MSSPKQILDAFKEEKRKEIIEKISSLKSVKDIIDLLKAEGVDCDEKTAQSFLDALCGKKLSDDILSAIAGGSPSHSPDPQYSPSPSRGIPGSDKPTYMH